MTTDKIQFSEMKEDDMKNVILSPTPKPNSARTHARGQWAYVGTNSV
jgi:hypothetical protein